MNKLDNCMRDKICLVCGDKALGYNFNAITCESCKAFFRRNALKNKTFKCPFNEKCDINTVTRRFCQSCRLVKCFEIGMKKEYIMSEDEKQAKKKKTELKKTNSDVRESEWESEKITKKMKFDKSEEHSSYLRLATLDYDTGSTVSPSSPFLNHSSDVNAIDDSRSTPNSKACMPPTEIDCAGPGLSPHESANNSYGNSSLPSCRRGGEMLAHHSNSHNVDESCSLDLRCVSSASPKRENVRDFTDSAPLASPMMAEPASPIGSAVIERSSASSLQNTNQSRSLEIYQLSKACELSKALPNVSPTACDIKRVQNVSCAQRPAKSTDSLLAESPRNAWKCGRPMPLLSSLVGSGQTSTSQERSFRVDVADEVFHDIPNQKTRSDLNDSMDSILTEAIKLEYEAYSSMNPRINSRELNDAERAKLNELIVANKALQAPLEDDNMTSGVAQAMSKNNLGSKPMLVDVLNLTAVAIRRLIKMSKKVNAFKNMCQEDQVALLKGGCTEMMILRSAMTYDSDRGSWKIPHSAERLMNIKVDILKEAGGRVFEEHQRFLQTFEPRWRNDENIMLILSAITLFTPERPRVVHYDVIKLEQNSYYYLLRRYLESVYPGCEARSTFLKLIHKIAELHRLNEDHVRVYMELNPEDVEPLLIEIFDLTH